MSMTGCAMSFQDAARPRQQKRRPFATLRAQVALMLREMSTSYGRSPGGYLWAILEPVAGIALMTLVFSALFRTPPLGINFPTFYATGMLPFTLFNTVHNKVSQSLLYSRQLLAYPTVTYLDAILARFVLNTMTEVMVAYIVLTGCLTLFETRTTLDLPVIVEGFALVAVLALGVGTLNCYLFTRFNVMQQVWSILMRPMFIISGIFFLYETIPVQYQGILWWNPLIHITGMVRSGFYASYDANYASPTYVLTISLSCLALGLVLLRRHHRDLLTRS